jgi:hypothetical protein
MSAERELQNLRAQLARLHSYTDANLAAAARIKDALERKTAAFNNNDHGIAAGGTPEQQQRFDAWLTDHPREYVKGSREYAKRLAMFCAMATWVDKRNERAGRCVSALLDSADLSDKEASSQYGFMTMEDLTRKKECLYCKVFGAVTDAEPLDSENSNSN